ncbi:MAG: ATP-grasp domain-containing protein [Enterococcus sp.]
MKVLVLSVGIRVKLIQALKNAGMYVIATDCSPAAPGLYVADEYQLTLPFGTQEYLEELLVLCKEKKIDGIFSLIDPEIDYLAEHASLFSELGTTPILSSRQTITQCFDKLLFAKECQMAGIPTTATYEDFEEFALAYQNKKIEFPVFVKPRCGSASIAIQKIQTSEELQHVMKNNPDLIIQKFMNGIEYGVDLYCDLKTGEIIQFFIKEKLKMRAGETDKARSVANEQIDGLLLEVAEHFDLRGPIDLDIFEVDGKFYLSEINPRFGGGYPFAEISGATFAQLILKNLSGEINVPQKLIYETGQLLMKYPEVIVAPNQE